MGMLELARGCHSVTPPYETYQFAVTHASGAMGSREFVFSTAAKVLEV